MSIRWGVLSTAKIGVEKVIPALQQSQLGTVTAIASRSGERAGEAAQKLGIARSCGSYEELLADPEIDAIYNPLPNHLHVPWSIAAIEAGKHVLCEKPIGLDAADARKLRDASSERPDLKVMEGFMYRFHPQWKVVRSLIADGTIGELRAVQSSFHYFNVDPENVRNKPGIGGGGLLDIGCYSVSLSRWLFGREPDRVLASIDIDERFGVDRFASAILDFGSRSSVFTCSTQAEHHQHVSIHGTDGKIELRAPFTPAPSDRVVGVHAQGIVTKEIIVEPSNQYTLQGDLFARAILDATEVPTPLDDAVANMSVIDALVLSSERSTWVQPSELA